jgi:hypothetical protein
MNVTGVFAGAIGVGSCVRLISLRERGQRRELTSDDRR